MNKTFRITVDVQIAERDLAFHKENFPKLSEQEIIQMLINGVFFHGSRFPRAQTTDSVEIIKGDWNPENKPLHWCEECRSYHVDGVKDCMKVI